MLLRCLLLLTLFLCAGGASAADRPNILWITAEDMSPALGCYGDSWAVTPHIDRLAAESVKYSHAFATAPVCSPARSTLITGCYATSLGTHHMRSAMPIPEAVRGFPAYLREAGYFTSNNSKTDYNTSAAARLIEESWDESGDTAHWRDRKDVTQPFFSVFNLMTTHQSRTMVWPYERFQAEIQSQLAADLRHDPAEASLPPYYPDTAVIRREWARFYDCVTVMDQQVGALLQQLAEDGLQDNTIVFFFSDHGSGMPRHKRAVLDTGMHVPLLIRFPPAWRHLSGQKPGEVTNRLVSFVDFPPTVLRLAGHAVPEYMQGVPFAGLGASNARTYAFGHRDRVDEAFDCARSVRGRRYLYIRNYMPHLSYHQPTAWPDQGQIRQEFDRLAGRKTMTAAQWHYVGPTKPVEELYDCVADPLNLTNLAADDEHRDVLGRMRGVLRQHLRDSGDLGFIPEAVLSDALTQHISEDNPAALQDLAERFRSRADRTGLYVSFDLSGDEIDYWQAVALQSHGLTEEMEQRLTAGPLVDWDSKQSISTGIQLAPLLVRGRRPAAGLDLLVRATQHDDLNIVLQAARTLELLGDSARPAIPAMRELAARCQSILPAATTATFVQSPEQDLAMFISFSANAFLRKQAAADQNGEGTRDE
ncbi:MAG: sulfatase [Fuerstiella sp.]